MQVRIFESEDMATGLKMVKRELGPDALILSTRTIHNGKLGLLGKPMLEITAAIDPGFEPITQKGQGHNGMKPQIQFRKKAAKFSMSPRPKTTRKAKPLHCVVDDSTPEVAPQQMSDKIFSIPAAYQMKQQAPPVETSKPAQDLHEELADLKSIVKNMAGQIVELARKQHQTQRATSQKNDQNQTDDNTFFDTGKKGRTTAALRPLLHFLDQKGLNEQTSQALLQKLPKNAALASPDKQPANRPIVKAAIQQFIKVERPAFANNSQKQRIALVGPTGVGKTTTLAKIAASCLANHSSSVGLITIDTYRIAAVEQLRIYADIMGLPLEVVLKPQQLERALAKFRHKDLVLIDTAGRSPRDGGCIDELTNYFPPESDVQKQLVLSLTTRENELVETIKRFAPLGIAGTILTKSDECSQLGCIANVQRENPSPLSYLTNGQRVPEDILEVSPESVAELILSHNEG